MKTKKDSRINVEKAIELIAKKMINNSFYYFNEEDVRADLYSEIKKRFKHEILLCSEERDTKGKRFKEKSSAIHCDAIIKEDDESERNYHKVDLLIHYGYRRVPVHFHKGKIHFLKNKTSSRYGIRKHLEKRRIVEIKMSKASGGVKKTVDKVEKDADKRRKVAKSNAYYIFVCRNDKPINEDVRKSFVELTRQNKKEIVYYISLQGCIRFKNGKPKKVLQK